jgi:hypothetical protein
MSQGGEDDEKDGHPSFYSNLPAGHSSDAFIAHTGVAVCIHSINCAHSHPNSAACNLQGHLEIRVADGPGHPGKNLVESRPGRTGGGGVQPHQ